MKTRFTQLLVSCLFVLMSCGGDDPSDSTEVPEPPKEKCLLQKQITSTLITTFNRNTEGLATRIDYDYKNQSVVYKTTCLLEYDGSGHLITITGEDYSFTYEYDSQGKIVLEKYDAVMDPTKIYSYPYQRSFIYDDLGRLIKITGEPSYYERYEYDASGRLIKTFLSTSTQPEYLKIEYLSYDGNKSPYLESPFAPTIHVGMSQVHTIICSLRPVVSENNALSVRSYLPDGTFSAQNVVYSYNESGYPTSINGSNVSFEYECK